jgi:hypothetical protein
MMEYKVFIDRNRYTYLQYRDGEKTRQFVSMISGKIDTVSLGRAEFNQLIEYTAQTPQHFAEVYLKSYMEISRAARAVLAGVLGGELPLTAEPSAPSFSSGAVGLEEICEALKITPQVARKHLRKLVDKPGGRWEWEPDQAEKIKQMLTECIA